jgi:cyclopropane fatty-acyl-phospholipid synthase-like methyltransferase
MDATHQRWARENIILRERANTVLRRYQRIRADLEEHKEESRSLRRQFNSVTEHVDVLTEFLEKLRDKTAGYECAIYRGGQPNSANASK